MAAVSYRAEDKPKDRSYLKGFFYMDTDPPVTLMLPFQAPATVHLGTLN